MKKRTLRKRTIRKRTIRKRRRGGAIRPNLTDQEQTESRIRARGILPVEDERHAATFNQAQQLENIFPEQIPHHTVETARLVDEAIREYGMVIQSIPMVHGREMLIHGSLQPRPWYFRFIRRSQLQIEQLEPHRQFLCDTLSISPFLADVLGFAYAYKRQNTSQSHTVRLPILRSLQLAFPDIGFSENAVQYRYASLRLSAILSMGSLPIFRENIDLLEIGIPLFSALSYIYDYDPTMVAINIDTVIVSVLPHRPWIRGAF